ncbi:MAG: amidohydrolase family protein [Opitutales bacterium]|nr:amidohydrolase family protein [Opitutales bacterium]MBT5167781.1 amidohydrolase family protein [Opitutales bacterium]MBT5814554.1 amidohydrolase family protein [Opitutales bacterium]MBT6381061.1 amidohydrolase family protein [Opitutales bacterium]MBT6770660.1 amidohydrolase family protein [Opitutales bacterium]
MKIDSHQHFWKYDANDYPWIGAEHLVIKRDFFPGNLKPILKASDIVGCIAVQARQTLEETNWLIELAEQNAFIKGVVGWLPLCDLQIDQTLEQYADRSHLVGVRHIIHDEPDDQFILRADFNEGISRLAPHDLVYDILIFEKHLSATIEFVDRHPNIQFVVDHIAKPKIHPDTFDQNWKTNLIELARRENVSCKLSGMVTEAPDFVWDQQLLTPYFETALEAFGPNRLLFGSDWPVSLLGTDYGKWIDAVNSALNELSLDEQAAIWGKNAQRIYKLAT